MWLLRDKFIQAIFFLSSCIKQIPFWHKVQNHKYKTVPSIVIQSCLYMRQERIMPVHYIPAVMHETYIWLSFRGGRVHYNDVIMCAMASQITSHTIVYSTVSSDSDQIKHQSSASLAIVLGIHRWPVNSPHKLPVRRKIFPFDDIIMLLLLHSIYMVEWLWQSDTHILAHSKRETIKLVSYLRPNRVLTNEIRWYISP